ncbi:uncharacterized protein DS421_15g495200 [Arachis hypogaea]|nr:uncharacterized protein DS421_15g495200 [Arachis hypogaea]
MILKFPRGEVFLGVERQFVTYFWRSTLACNVLLAFNSRLQRRTGVQRSFTSSKLGQCMDYYILLEIPECLLSNAIGSVPF